MSSYINPLDLEYIFVNTLAGSPEVFTAIFIIGFSIFAGIFKMGNYTYMILLVLASMLLYGFLGGGLFLFVIFIGGLIIFNIISRIIKD